MDIGNVSVKELLEKKMGPEGAQRVIDAVNDGYKNGKRGNDLQQQYQDAMVKEGQDIPSDPGDILYGFIFL